MTIRVILCRAKINKNLLPRAPSDSQRADQWLTLKAKEQWAYVGALSLGECEAPSGSYSTGTSGLGTVEDGVDIGNTSRVCCGGGSCGCGEDGGKSQDLYRTCRQQNSCGYRERGGGKVTEEVPYFRSRGRDPITIWGAIPTPTSFIRK